MGGRIVREPLKAMACLSALFYLNWKLTVVFLFFMPILGGLVYLLGQRLKRAANRLLDSMSRLYTGLEETFHNAKAVIAYDQAGRHRRSFHRENKNFYKQAMKLVQIRRDGGPLPPEMLGMVAASAVLLPAAFLVLRGTTSIWGVSLANSPPKFPELALFYVLLAGVLEPMRKFSKFYTAIRHSTAIAERLFLRMDARSLIEAPATAQFLPPLSQKIDICDIQFSYQSAANDRTDRGPVLSGTRFDDSRRRNDCDRRPERIGKIHADQSAASILRSRSRLDLDRRNQSEGCPTARRPRTDDACFAGDAAVRRHDSGKHSIWATQFSR